MDTPEFLAWALEYSCPVRGFQDGSDPERTERQLRAARAVSDARHERRIFEGLCVDPPNGFPIERALAVYGGLEAIQRECGGCLANALVEIATGTLCGCYGLVALPEDPAPVHQAVERGIDAAYPGVDWSSVCQVTTPRWYGLWLNPVVEAELLLIRYRVLQCALIEDQHCRLAIGDLRIALNVAFDIGCRLHVRLYPRGVVQDGWWQLKSHCPRCKAEWHQPRMQQCRACGYAGHPASDKKRRARGRRPYFPLDRLLGQQPAAEFLSRYAAFRGQEESKDLVQSPPRVTPPDNPPDD
jgi:hypothetical protein